MITWPHRDLPAGTGQPNGFTLLELLVVLAILGLLGALLPQVTHRSPGLDVRGAAATLAADLRLLRSEARRQHITTELILGAHGYALRPDAGDRETPRVSVSYAPQEPDMLDRPADRLRFFPDGSASGGTLTIRSGAAMAMLQVGWLDGAVSTRAR